jgi:hypothetical protein
MYRVVLIVVLALGSWMMANPHAQLRTFYVNNDIACQDASGWGTSPATPYCTMAFPATFVIPGDMVIVASTRDCAAPVDLTRSGTLANPITFQTTVGTIMGRCTDLNDAGMVAEPSIGANIYSLTNAANPGTTPRVFQTYFDPILVDDPNASIYYMYDHNHPRGGPIVLKSATSDAEMVANEGAYRWVGTTLYVHPFSNRVPSATNTDFVRGGASGMTVSSSTNYNVIDGFTYAYPGTVSSSQVLGGLNILRNMTYVGLPLVIKGSGTLVENFRVFHSHDRSDVGEWSWHFSGSGIAATIFGTGHTLRNGEVYANWNSQIGSENTTGPVTYENIRAYSSPNHCAIGNKGQSILKNTVQYNCQDYQWVSDINNMIIEHSVIAGSGIPFESINGSPLGPFTMRYSISQGNFTWVRPVGSPNCTWEPGSIIEYNVFQDNSTIEHCEGTGYVELTHAAYTAACAAGTLTNCATFRNNTYVSSTEWDTVLTDGFWSSALADTWDVTLPLGSPAINIGPGSGLTTTDIIGIARPQPIGGLVDAGAYEFTGDSPPSTIGPRHRGRFRIRRE